MTPIVPKYDYKDATKAKKLGKLGMAGSKRHWRTPPYDIHGPENVSGIACII